METLQSYSYQKLREQLEGDGISPSHALPIFRSIQAKLSLNPAEEEHWSSAVQDWLKSQKNESLVTTDQSDSSDGWTCKSLHQLSDGSEVEAVLMGFTGRLTACLSSQVGCAMGCVFCATGQMGFSRHMTTSEIVAQAHTMEREARKKDDHIRNIVMMGMGEPLHNYDAVMEALDILTDTKGLSIAPSRVSVSTVGHVDGIRRFAHHPKKYSLAVSLHGVDDEERNKLIPINRRWPLAELLDACREFSAIRQDKIFFAWTLISGVNDDPDHALRLAELLKGLNAHVNLIPLNPTEGFDAEEPNQERIEEFHRILRDKGLPSTLRQKRGIDVDAGCGQLKAARKKKASSH